MVLCRNPSWCFFILGCFVGRYFSNHLNNICKSKHFAVSLVSFLLSSVLCGSLVIVCSGARGQNQDLMQAKYTLYHWATSPPLKVQPVLTHLLKENLDITEGLDKLLEPGGH